MEEFVAGLTITGLLIEDLIVFVAGAIALLGYKISRMLKSDGWDKSNMTNALRLESHETMHPEDFGRMYYLTHAQMDLLRNNGHEPDMPFGYISLDELSEVVKTRPTEDHV